MALPKLMRATGHGSFSQTLGEFSAYFILMTINVCVIVLLAMFVVGDSFGTIPDFASMESMSPGSLILALTAPLVLVTSFQFMLYELCDTVVNGVLLQFATTVVLAFVGGCFYPVNFLPDGMQKIASFLPTGMVREYVSEVILGHSMGTKAVVLLGVSAVFIAVCVAVRKFKIVNS
jgi:ABC-2 type transport system permease protein